MRLPHTLALGLMACFSRVPAEAPSIENVYVDDFHSDDESTCRPSDVPIDHARASEFFRIARPITSRELHDHYDIAPCFVAGPLRYQGRVCTFEIRAGATATITCNQEVYNFACDSCRTLFAAH
jgi:hypothetical protein